MHWSYRRSVSTFCALLTCTLPAMAAPPQDALAHMTMAQKHAAQKYFRAHALGFSQNYGLYHPGPYWILHHLPPFHLSALQMRQERHLKLGMAQTTIRDNRRLQAAYAHYQKDSAVRHPNIARIHADIRRIGHLQTELAFEMVPYHERSYRILMPKQRAVYHQLVDARVRKKQSEAH